MPQIKRQEHGFRSGKQRGNNPQFIVLSPARICEQYINCELMQAIAVSRHRFPCNQTIEAGCVLHIWTEFGPNKQHCDHNIPHTNLITISWQFVD